MISFTDFFGTNFVSYIPIKLETVDREHSAKKWREEKTNKKTKVTMANLTPDDRDAKSRTNKSLWIPSLSCKPL